MSKPPPPRGSPGSDDDTAFSISSISLPSLSATTVSWATAVAATNPRLASTSTPVSNSPSTATSTIATATSRYSNSIKRVGIRAHRKVGRKGAPYSPVKSLYRKRRRHTQKQIEYASKPQGLEDDVDDPCNIGHEGRRQLISMFYLEVLNQPSSSQWHGDDGTICNIMKGLNLNCDQKSLIVSTSRLTLQSPREIVTWARSLRREDGLSS